MSWIKDRFNEILNPFVDKEKDITQEETEEKEYKIHSIQIGEEIYWLPDRIIIPENFSQISAFIKIFCELLELEKIDEVENNRRMKEIHEKELKETEENKDGNE